MRASIARPKPTPIEDPAALAAFCVASEELGGDGHLVDLLLLDAGLRLGEVGGLRWECFWWGSDANDTSRSLSIEQTRPRGRFDSSTPKSGIARKVALSRRLRRVLRSEWMRRGQPMGRIFGRLNQSNYRIRHFAKVCQRAGIGRRRPKDLRDTFASQLVSSGISLAYVSRQLGHKHIAITSTHYAAWAGGDTYRPPLELRDGEIPADVLARLSGAEASPRRSKTRRRRPSGVTKPR